MLLEEFGNVIGHGGAGVVIASQSGHRLGALTAEQDAALATTPPDELLALPMLQPYQVTDSLHAYQLAKRANSLRVLAEAVRWGKRGARINTISPGIIITPLAKDELIGPRGEGYRRMIELSPAGRAGTPDEVGTVGALLMGADGASPPPTSTASSPRIDQDTCEARQDLNGRPSFRAATRNFALRPRSVRRRRARRTGTRRRQQARSQWPAAFKHLNGTPRDLGVNRGSRPVGRGLTGAGPWPAIIAR